MSKQPTKEVVPLLLCGGIGKRLWPLSRENHPKQMLRLYNDKTLIQNSLLRVQQIPNLEKPIVVCNKKSRFIVRSQIEEIQAPVREILLETKSLNTAPAVALAALHLQQEYGDVLMLVMPVDHKMEGIEKLAASIEAALPYAQDDKIVTFGVKPKMANTHYGYIEIVDKKDKPLFSVKRFIEKPNLQTAQAFLESQNFYWNTGIYLFSAGRILREFEKFNPDILKFCKQALSSSWLDHQFIFTGEEFKNCPSISIDHAIMEKTDQIVMTEMQATWIDIGNWQLLYDTANKNEQGNVLHGNIMAVDTKNSYIRTEHSLIATLGLENCFVIETRDVTLIADKDHLDKIPQVVDDLMLHHRTEAATPATVHRPWGHYTTIESGTNFQIKKIVVHPQQRLSLQEHQYRSEHWVILKGKAVIILGHETYTLGPNESTFVPIGVRHQIINNEDSDLEFIEVQMGSYLREDDIKRFDDIYHRDKDDQESIGRTPA